MTNTKSLPEVLISIVTWNHENTIRATLESIARQTYQHYRVVVFDNNSADQTIAIVQSFLPNERIALIQNEDNVGFCGGHNFVIRNYSFDYVLLVNPDIILKDNYIEEALRPFEQDDQIGAVCGLLLQSFDENPLIDSAGMSLLRSRRFTLIHHGLPLQSVTLESQYVTGLDGALPMFKSSAVKSLLIDGAFFNELFFSHKEDWDVSWRLLLYGWKTFFSKECVAIHPRHFKPNNLKERLRINTKIKYDAFKNQFLLLLINEDKQNFVKDSFSILPRLCLATLFCFAFERKSLKAFPYLLANRKQIWRIRKQVQQNRRVSLRQFRTVLQ